MADKPYKEDENKAYKPFDESEEVQYEFTEDSQGKKKLLSKFRTKPVLAVVILIVVVGLIYKVISVVKHHHQSSQMAVSTKQQALPALPTQAAVLSKPIKSVVLPPSHDKQVEESQQEAIVTLQKMQEQTQQHLAQLDQSVEQVGEQINAIATQLGEITQQVKTFSVEKAKQEVSKIDLQKKQDAAVRAKLNYFVQAVIPGRAWLKSPNGQAITVAVGDSIQGYGKVLAIDSYSGTVTTSSGVTIPYGVSER